MFDEISHDFKGLIYFITNVDHKEKAPLCKMQQSTKTHKWKFYLTIEKTKKIILIITCQTHDINPVNFHPVRLH